MSRKGRNDKAQGHLEVAMDNLLAALVLVGKLPDVVPSEALDAALHADGGFQNARKRLSTALKGTASGEPGSGPSKVIMAIDETANAMVAEATGVGYRLGLRVGRGSRQ